MKYRNEFELIGRLGADPETVELGSGKMAVNLVLYTNMPFMKDGKTSYLSEKHHIAVYGRHAAYAAKVLKKGANVLLEGKVKPKKVTLQSGAEITVSQLVISEKRHAVMPLDPYEEPVQQQAQPAQQQAQPVQQQAQPDDVSEVGCVPNVDRYAPPPFRNEPDRF